MCFFHSRVDKFPILTSLHCHFAEQCILTLELSSNDLSKKEDLWNEISFGFKVVEVMKRRQIVFHLYLNIIQN